MVPKRKQTPARKIKHEPYAITWVNPNDDHFQRGIKLNFSIINDYSENGEDIPLAINGQSSVETVICAKRANDSDEDENSASKKLKTEISIENDQIEAVSDEQDSRPVVKEEEELIIIDSSLSDSPHEPEVPKPHKNHLPNTCATCHRIFRRKVDLTRHRQTHVEAKLECEYCGVKFKVAGHYRKHECNFCAICWRTFDSKQQMAAHRRREHAQSLFTCDICNREFRYHINLLNHMRAAHIQAPQRDYHCDICGKVYNAKKKMRRHVKHHGGRAECRLCGKHVKQINLGSHTRFVHTTERNHACELCGLRFKTRECLKSHKRTHERRFTCRECGKKLTTQGLLDEHIAAHRSPERLTCKLCGLLFPEKFCLRTHMKLHRSRFKCGECNYTTEKDENFRKHELRHKRKEENEKLTKDWFKCDICRTKLKNKLKLATHYWKKHNVLNS